MALRWIGDRFEKSAARPLGYERPWAWGPFTTSESGTTPLRPAARDATPRVDDLEAGD